MTPPVTHAYTKDMFPFESGRATREVTLVEGKSVATHECDTCCVVQSKSLSSPHKIFVDARNLREKRLGRQHRSTHYLKLPLPTTRTKTTAHYQLKFIPINLNLNPLLFSGRGGSSRTSSRTKHSAELSPRSSAGVTVHSAEPVVLLFSSQCASTTMGTHVQPP